MFLKRNRKQLTIFLKYIYKVTVPVFEPQVPNPKPPDIMPVYQLTDKLVFPPPEHADPDGLLAVGGDLSMKRLLLAYRMGLFPWYARIHAPLWWSPDPRLILKPKDLCVSKRLARTIKQGPFKITLDQAFEDVIRGCAHVKRPRQKGTWIMDEMIDAYCCLHQEGYAHSVESWQDGKLVGGLTAWRWEGHFLASPCLPG